jgi:hypothetical protein
LCHVEYQVRARVTGLSITSAIPPVIDDYPTIVILGRTERSRMAA